MQEVNDCAAGKRKASAAASALVPLALAAVFATPVVAYANPEDGANQSHDVLQAYAEAESACGTFDVVERAEQNQAVGKHFAPDAGNREVAPSATENLAGGGRIDTRALPS